MLWGDDMKLGTLSTLAVLVWAVAGCATVTRGTTQSIAIETDPPGANCTITQDNKEVVTLAATPGAAVVDRRAVALEVSCRAPGYLEERRRLASIGDARNVLDQEVREPDDKDKKTAVGYGGAQAAGSIGAPLAAMHGLAYPAAAATMAPLAIGALALLPVVVIVDMASGAAFTYPRLPLLILAPSEFESAAARDAFFAQRRAAIEDQAARVRAQVLDRCSRIYCPRMVAEVDDALK